jgi:2,3-bisphosphoglycerate-dependent phosphoglycerate mutase
MTAGLWESHAHGSDERAAVGAVQRPFRLPPGATEVVLVRHGASAEALPGAPFPLLDGRGNPSLSENGERQAELVAQRLAREQIAKLFVTPLQRTALTAEPLVAATGLSATVIDELAEVRLGDWEGGEYRVRAARGDPIVRRAFEEERWDVIPNGETPESLARRVRTGIDKVVKATGPDAVAVAVVHGAVIGEACRQASGSRRFAFVHSDNGSITRLVIGADGRWLLLSFNDVSHLVV